MRRFLCSLGLLLAVAVLPACSSSERGPSSARSFDQGDVRTAMRADFVVTVKAAERLDRRAAPGDSYDVDVVQLKGVSTLYGSNREQLPDDISIGVPLIDSYQMMEKPEDLVGATLLLERSDSPSQKEAGLPPFALQLLVRETGGKVELPGFKAATAQLNDFLNYLRRDESGLAASDLVVTWVRELSDRGASSSTTIDQAYREYLRVKRGGTTSTLEAGMASVPLQILLDTESSPRGYYEIRAGERSVWKRDVQQERVAGVVQRGSEQEWTVVRLVDDGSELLVGRFNPHDPTLAAGVSVIITNRGSSLHTEPFDPKEFVDPEPPTTVVYGG